MTQVVIISDESAVINQDLITAERQSGNALSNCKLTRSLNGLLFYNNFFTFCRLKKNPEKYVHESFNENLAAVIYTYMRGWAPGLI